MPDSIDKFLLQYDRLSPFEQTLLQFLSVIYEPAHNTLIVNCLRELDIRSPRGNRPTAANLNHYFSKFRQAGLLTKNHQCPQSLVETLSRIAVKNGRFEEFAKVIRDEAPVSYYYGKWTTRCWRAMREIRIGIYTQNFELIDSALEFLSGQCRDILSSLPPTVQVATSPFDPIWFRSLAPSFQFFLLDTIFRHGFSILHSYSEILTYLQEETGLEKPNSDEKVPFQRLLFTQLLFRGRLEEAQNLVSENSEVFCGTGAAGVLAFLSGDSDSTPDLFQTDLDFLSDLSGSENVAFFGATGLLHTLASLQIEQTDPEQKVAQQIAIALTLFPGNVEERAYQILAAFLQARHNNTLLNESLGFHKDEEPHSLTILFTALCQYWLNSSLQPDVKEQVDALYQQALANDFHFFSLNLAAILAGIGQNAEENNSVVKRLQETTGLFPLINVLKSEEPWKRNLKALIQITSSPQENNISQSERLIWMIDDRKGKIQISPKEQKLNPSGAWSKGRPISLSRLYSGKLVYLTIQDRKIATSIQKKVNPETHGVSYSFAMDKALPAMINHPLLFLAKSPATPVEFVSGEPELLVEERGSQLHIRFSQKISDDNITVFHETPTRYKIIEINDNHRRIAQITGENGLTVPIEASDQVLTAIGNISSFMTVHSAIAADATADSEGNIEFVEADPSIYMHLLPYGTGFRLEMFVKPFAEGGHYLKPGQGVENIMAEVRGRRLQTKRNLALEEQKAREIEESCPILDLAIDLEQENDREWHLQDPDDCLHALQELQNIQDQVIIEWPEGEKLSISHQASLKNLNLKVRTNQQNWFALSGELRIDQDTVIELRELLAKVKTAHGRFIQIGEGQFLALTQEFKKKLEEINLFAEGYGGEDDEELLIHRLAAIPLEKLVNEAQSVVDEGWKNQIRNIHESQTFVPQLPSTLQAELRDYQIEGYNWLSRLAYWGVGGCLADDMGLGKTIQSLAIVLSLASDGPSLVVAPTSVSNNWQTEANRFTPTLTIKTLTGKDRAQTIQELGKFDLLITTYTLLQQENDLLSSVKWQTVILDEAQAIKNAATKRSKAAMALQAQFKLLTTGTPVENHLGELWNLFHFINPGLLGSLNRFNERFAIPIERYRNREARLKLKKLIRPFILRRIKSEVLEELPPRTEITLEVEMSEEEMLFYEALRQNALEVLENSREKKARHLQILTEIMKLRQACCNPRLIAADTRIASSKLKVFAAVVEELLGGNHKALVFSQFIGHLSILREYLDKKGIEYRYLDGTTSTIRRKQEVDDFQAGKGDLFLISLKAGGLGLNLTAADYVLHMDPWWNPAVEDQASDRAHRIGQTRPVTIYRLVCQRTIEEKIVKLHQEKRDLAGSLLEGSDMSAKMSSEDLLDLIRGS
ncbi:MAG: DEAD/DEAH box helicase [Proteobacteria bacterium]|nr:DEAD/DEAH box helicase [Pseudomonadota bacterium]MBU1058626.1 DEAD/DEAH box helicase [Pseudomonadota bacterium]